MPRKKSEPNDQDTLGDQKILSVDDGYLVGDLQNNNETTTKERTYLESYTDPDWSDYVMSLFAKDELQGDNPKTDGLRRVAQKLIGQIAESKTKIVQAPTKENGNRASVEHTIVFALRSFDDSGIQLYKTIMAVADCWSENTISPYNQHPSATAETRAEGRALRKALGIKNISAEEKSVREESDIQAAQDRSLFDNEALIDEGRVLGITLLCQRCNINVSAFINSGKRAYNDIKEVPYDVSTAMIKRLGEYFRGEKEIPGHLLEVENSSEKG
jgi:hypothetical protein